MIGSPFPFNGFFEKRGQWRKSRGDLRTEVAHLLAKTEKRAKVCDVRRLGEFSDGAGKVGIWAKSMF